MLPTSYYDQRRADFAVNFLQMLKLTKGEWYGQLLKLVPYQETIIRDVFGIVDRNTGLRQFRTVYVHIPKKNMKSELAAGVAILQLIGDAEPAAEVYLCAADTNQASIIYNTCKTMIELSPALLGITKVIPSTKRIVFPKTKSFLRVLSADAKAKAGFSVSSLFFDELYAQPNRELYDIMTKYTGDARRQPLYWLMSTSGFNKQSVCYELFQKSKDILSGAKIDSSFYPVIYAIDEETESWEDPDVWRRVNPAIGVSIKFETIQEAYEQAKQNAADELMFRTLRLNTWLNATTAYFPMDRWDKCADNYGEADLEGRDCYAGLDLSSTTDLTALVLAFPPTATDEYYWVLSYFWLPENVIDVRSRRDRVPYKVWEKQGVFNTTDGDVVDYDRIVAFIDALSERYNIRELSFDRWNSEGIRRDLEELGAEKGFDVLAFGQGFASMSAPTKDLLQLILEDKIRHNNNPVLNWNMGNAVAEIDAAGNVKLSKKKSTEKIDGTISLIMGLARAMLHTDNADSVYNNRDILFI
jgi:phage terminase large subunit-like protein